MTHFPVRTRQALRTDVELPADGKEIRTKVSIVRIRLRFSGMIRIGVAFLRRSPRRARRRGGRGLGARGWRMEDLWSRSFQPTATLQKPTRWLRIWAWPAQAATLGNSKRPLCQNAGMAEG